MHCNGRGPPCGLGSFNVLTSTESRLRIWCQRSAFGPPPHSGLDRCPCWDCGSVVVDSKLIVAPIVGFCVC